MIFHELAHQVVYAQGDSQFNESFASTVEEVGVEQWLERFGSQAMRDSYARYRAARRIFSACCSSTARRWNRTTP
jgi:predicted aminopeptidase